MAGKIGKLVYDGSIEIRATEEDLGVAITEVKSERGEWPGCLGPNPLGDDKTPLLTSIPCDPPYGEKKCSCDGGRHTMFWLRPPKEIWPDLEMALVRVFAGE